MAYGNLKFKESLKLNESNQLHMQFEKKLQKRTSKLINKVYSEIMKKITKLLLEFTNRALRKNDSLEQLEGKFKDYVGPINQPASKMLVISKQLHWLKLFKRILIKKFFISRLYQTKSKQKKIKFLVKSFQKQTLHL